MPAFGKDGIVNLNQSSEKEVWNITDSEGKVIMSCNDMKTAMIHKESLSQKMNKELTVKQGKLRCL